MHHGVLSQQRRQDDQDRRDSLEHREIPFDLPQMGLSLFRSAAEGDEPGVRWFLDRVTAAFRRLNETQ